MARGFGLGKPTGILGLEEAAGSLPDPKTTIDAVNMAIGQCTPPVGISLFVATGIAKARLGEILGAYSKYLLTMIVVLALITVFPQIITFLPNAVMGLK